METRVKWGELENRHRKEKMLRRNDGKRKREEVNIHSGAIITGSYIGINARLRNIARRSKNI